MIPTANSFGGCIIHFGGCDLHFRGYTLHSWRVRFAFWGVHLHFGGYTVHSWRVRFAFWGVHCAFLEGAICILGGTLCILGGCDCIMGGTLAFWGVHFAFCIYTLHSWRVHFHSWGCTLYFGGLFIILDSGYTLLSWDSTHNKQIHGWGFILWVHCIFGPQFCA